MPLFHVFMGGTRLNTCMAKVLTHPSDFKKYVYGETDTMKVGVGTDEKNYSNKAYAKKKTTDIMMGTINRLSYLGYELDKEPLVLVSWYNPAYNVIEGVNINYLPVAIRRNLVKYVKKTNALRIKAGKPLLIDYHDLKKAIPEIQGAWRRYKVIATKGEQIVRLDEWESVLTESTKYKNHYKFIMAKLRKPRG